MDQRIRNLLLLAVCLAGCSSTALKPDAGGGDPDGGSDHRCPFQLFISANIRNQVDILFVLGNGRGMEPMSMELRNRIPSFLEPYARLADTGTYADLHIGVVTTDHGAGGGGAPGCDASPGGQRGRLQALGANAPKGCKRPVDANYIRFAFDKNGAGANNLPWGQNLVETFQCMASVGDSGCPFAHPLEAAYAALHDSIPENKGFLREDALLVVVFLTDRDDASAPPDSDAFDGAKNRPYEDRYDAARFGVLCCPPGRQTCEPRELVFPPDGDSGGPLAGCRPAPNLPTSAGPGKLFDVRRYIDFFNKPLGLGGVKSNPLDVVLVGIDGPEEPFQVIQANPQTPAAEAFAACAPLAPAGQPPCVPVLERSCRNPSQPEFRAEPAVRLNTVIRSSRKFAIESICESNYAVALDSTAKEIVSAVSGGCIPFALPPDANGGRCRDAEDCPAGDLCNAKGDCVRVHCTVTDVTETGKGVFEVGVPPCTGGDLSPCWRVEPKGNCAGPAPEGLGFTVDRHGQSAPLHTTTRFICDGC